MNEPEVGGMRQEVEDHQTTSLTLELREDASLLQHQPVVVNSTAIQPGVHGRGGMDLSVNGHHDHYSLASSTSSSAAAAAAAAPLSRHQHPLCGNSDSTTLQKQLEHVNGLHAGEPFPGANHCRYFVFFLLNN